MTPTLSPLLARHGGAVIFCLSGALVIAALNWWIYRRCALRAMALVRQYQQRDEEEAARDDRIWKAVRRTLGAKPSRIAITLPDVVTDSEAATEVLMLTVGGGEVDR